MKRDLDLRSADYKKAYCFFTPGRKALILILAAMMIAVAAPAALHRANDHLRRACRHRAEILEALTAEAKPLIALEQETAIFNETVALGKTATEAKMPVARCLREAGRSAADHDLILTTMVMTSEGTLEIAGTSPALENVALYSQLLAEKPYIKNAEIETLGKIEPPVQPEPAKHQEPATQREHAMQTAIYRFIISGRLAATGGADR